jgi:hypothetical protein
MCNEMTTVLQFQKTSHLWERGTVQLQCDRTASASFRTSEAEFEQPSLQVIVLVCHRLPKPLRRDRHAVNPGVYKLADMFQNYNLYTLINKAATEKETVAVLTPMLANL